MVPGFESWAGNICTDCEAKPKNKFAAISLGSAFWHGGVLRESQAQNL